MKMKFLSTFLIVCSLITGCQNNEVAQSSSEVSSSSLSSSVSSSTVEESKPVSSSQASSASSAVQSSSSSKAESSSIASSSLSSSSVASSSKPKEDVASKPVSSSSATSSVVSSAVSSSEPPAPLPVEPKVVEEVSSVASKADTKVSYQSVFDTYSEKIKAAAPIAAKEYKKEAPDNTDGMAGLSIILDNKLGILADICIEGQTEINNIAYAIGDSTDGDAKKWADKLKAVYIKECRKIHDAYDSFAQSVDYYGELES